MAIPPREGSGPSGCPPAGAAACFAAFPGTRQARPAAASPSGVGGCEAPCAPYSGSLRQASDVGVPSSAIAGSAQAGTQALTYFGHRQIPGLHAPLQHGSRHAAQQEQTAGQFRRRRDL